MQAVVMVAMLSLIVTGLIKLSMSRQVLSHRLTSAQRTKQLAKGLEGRALACLENTASQTTCAATAGVTACFVSARNSFLAATGRTARITLSGTAPSCALQIEVDD